MPICVKCHKQFPSSIIVDGIKKPVRQRKHCYDCRSFGLTQKSPTKGSSKCVVCGRQYYYERKKGHTTQKCNTCMSNDRRFKRKKMAIEYKGGVCQICGYNKCLRALHFHHLDPNKKKFGICGNHSRSWKSIQEELDKCILVCSNCHEEIHDKKENSRGVA